MRKKILIGAVIIIAIIGLFLVSGNKKGGDDTTTNDESSKAFNLFKNTANMCIALPQDEVSKLLGKPVLKTSAVTTDTVHSCQYYLTDNQAVIINHDFYNIENQKKGSEALGRKITKSSQIPMENFLVIQEDGLINRLYLVLGASEYVSIDRTSSKTLTEDEMIVFGAKLADVLSGKTSFSASQSPIPTSAKTQVPLPQETDIIHTFLNLIGEKRSSDAVGMMNVAGDSDKQAWAVQFNAITSLKILSIEPSMMEDWTNTSHTYKVTLNVSMNPNSSSAPIPYYGWSNGQNIRWINLEKVGDLWKIAGISTGP